MEALSDILRPENVEYYLEIIDSAVSDKEDAMIPNDSVIHSQITIGKLMQLTNEKIAIYTKGFCENIGDELYQTLNKKYNYNPSIVEGVGSSFLQSLESLMSSNKDIYILIDSDCPTNVTDIIRKYQNRPNIRIRLIKEQGKGVILETFSNVANYLEMGGQVPDTYHLQVADDNMVRFEYDSPNRKAFVNFNNKEMGTRFWEVFNKVFTDTYSTNFKYKAYN